jgi:hypothetical protein
MVGGILILTIDTQLKTGLVRETCVGDVVTAGALAGGIDTSVLGGTSLVVVLY